MSLHVVPATHVPGMHLIEARKLLWIQDGGQLVPGLGVQCLHLLTFLLPPKVGFAQGLLLTPRIGENLFHLRFLLWSQIQFLSHVSTAAPVLLPMSLGKALFHALHLFSVQNRGQSLPGFYFQCAALVRLFLHDGADLLRLGIIQSQFLLHAARVSGRFGIRFRAGNPHGDQCCQKYRDRQIIHELHASSPSFGVLPSVTWRPDVMTFDRQYAPELRPDQGRTVQILRASIRRRLCKHYAYAADWQAGGSPGRINWAQFRSNTSRRAPASMYLSIKYKVLLTLVLVTIGAVLAMGLMVKWSFDRGFLRYVTAIEQATHQGLVDALAGEYRHSGGWERLRQNPRRFQELQLFNFMRVELRRHGGMAPPLWVGQIFAEAPMIAGTPFTAMPFNLPVPPPQLAVVLLNVDKDPVVGRLEDDDDLDLLPIKVSGPRPE